MPGVVADTGPLNYLVQRDAGDILPKLFDKIIVPVAVHDELTHLRAPAPVQAWAESPPTWLEVRPNPLVARAVMTPRSLEDGEYAAIALAREIDADLISDG